MIHVWTHYFIMQNIFCVIWLTLWTHHVFVTCIYVCDMTHILWLTFWICVCDMMCCKMWVMLSCKTCYVWHDSHYSHVAHKNESIHTFEWVMSHIRKSHVTPTSKSCHTHQWVISHIQMSHVTHTNESCHTYKWVMSHIQMSHVTHINKSCHTCGWVMTHQPSWRGKTQQHTATHRNTLQQTATHCNTIQHSAIRCNTLSTSHHEEARQTTKRASRTGSKAA